MKPSLRTNSITVVFLCQILASQAFQVSTSNGRVIGSERLKTTNGRKIYSFTGIPYAEPPVGELRFKEAKPARPWKEPFNATKDGSDCPQFTAFHSKGRGPVIIGNEDCLFVNVYSPKVDPFAKLPVMVFIHGGGFTGGSGRLYGPEFLLDRDVVLVTLNYRLNVLGFLSTGYEVFPANIGLKDQILALKWVQKNIKNLGGNPDLVTIFGESAGAVSTHLHLSAPFTKGLFHRAIAMSGSGFCPWAKMTPDLASSRTKQLADLSGCSSMSAAEMLKCMQAVPIETLLNATQKFQDWLSKPTVKFGPIIDKFITTNELPTTDRSKIESRVPFMTGINSAEGDIVYSSVFDGENAEKDIRSHPENALPSILLLQARFPKDKAPAVSREVKKFYFGEASITRDSSQKFVEMVTDDYFLTGMAEAAKKHTGDTYFYYYDYSQSVSFNEFFETGVKGVTHSDILLSLFPLWEYFPNRTLSTTDIKVVDKMLDIWTGFAKHGKPTDVANWEPTGKTTNTIKYLHITAEMQSVEENPLSKRLQFWLSLDSSQPGRKTS